MTPVVECPTPNKFGRCGCKACCAQCGFRKHTVVHGTPGEGVPSFVHEFVPVSEPKPIGGK